MRQGLVGDALGRPGRRLAYVAVERFGNAGEEVPFGTGKRRVKLPPTAGRFNKRRIFVNGIEALELRVRGYSCADIAKLYQKKPNYIGACISRAAEKLRRERIVQEFYTACTEQDIKSA